MTKTCKTCRYLSPKTGVEDHNQCRIRSPRVIPIPDGVDLAMWPEVYDNEWCGEHRPKEPDEPDQMTCLQCNSPLTAGEHFTSGVRTPVWICPRCTRNGIGFLAFGGSGK